MNKNTRFVILVLLCTSVVTSSNQALAAESFFEKATRLFRNASSQDETSSLSNSEITAGLREALSVGADKVVNQLGTADGFNKDPAIHIPLPGQLDTVRSVLDRLGMAGSLDELETRMNRAAETATPIAKDLFIQSIRDMTISDAQGILQGGNDSATQYFKQAMSPDLAREMLPIVQAQLANVGAAQTYENIVDKYNDVPLVRKVDMNLNEYVVQLTIDGIFHYLAQEEIAIRENPVARTTELLKKVFAQ